MKNSYLKQELFTKDYNLLLETIQLRANATIKWK